MGVEHGELTRQLQDQFGVRSRIVPEHHSQNTGHKNMFK